MLRRAFLFLSLWLCCAAPAWADKRVALVIGNSAYSATSLLSNSRNDAQLIADTLKIEGFDVTLVQDARQAEMLAALRAFNDASDGADWAMVYYAGHGMELGGENYLLPTDVKVGTDREAKDGAVPLTRVLEAVENAKKLRLVVLDACRNNPFAATMKRSLRVRAVDRGLKPPEPPAGVLVVYSAAAGEVAEDGASDHSPFTAALARRLQEPGLEASRLFNVVTADVFDATNGHQRPYLYGSNPIREELYFKPGAAAALATPGSPVAEQTWAFLKTSADPAALAVFLAGLSPDQPLRKEVEARIAVLRSGTPVQTAAMPVAPLAIASRQGEPTECDKLAASPIDPDLPKGFPSIDSRRINPEVAIPACEAALKAAPQDRRLHLQLARALGAAKKYAQASEEYERAVSAGSLVAINNLGAMYYYGNGVTQDYAKARELYEKAAAAGLAFSMHNLGKLYEEGRGTPQDYAKSREWFEKAAAVGDSQSMYDIGVLYMKGAGGQQDYAKAREWYEKAAAAGSHDAMNDIGVIYLEGKGVKQDYNKAREYFEPAAAAGNVGAMNNLGLLFHDGKGVAKDADRARDWYEKAAAAGSSVSMYNLAMNYERGQGMPRDLSAARAWYEKSAAAGNNDAKAALARLDKAKRRR